MNLNRTLHVLILICCSLCNAILRLTEGQVFFSESPLSSSYKCADQGAVSYFVKNISFYLLFHEQRNTVVDRQLKIKCKK
jgi:hypothetical protein